MEYLFKLKLLNGLLQGRELMLPAGRLLIGEMQEADLLLPLEGGLAVELQVDTAGVTFKMPLPPCWVAGHPWTDPECPLPLEQVIEIAGQAILLGKHDTPLPLCAVPDRKAPQRRLEDPQFTRSRCGSRRWWITGGLLFLLLSGTTGIVWKLQRGTPSPATTWSRTQIEQWLKQRCATTSFQHLKAEWQMDGTLTFSGRCRDSQQLALLMESLRAQRVFVQERAMCDDQLRRNVQYILHLFGYKDVTVEMTEKLGHLAIHGAIQADEQWSKVVDMLTALPGLEGWKIVNHGDEQLQKLLVQLQQSELLKKLNVIRSQGTLVVSGALDPNQVQQLETLLDIFRQQWQPAPKIVYQNIRFAETHSDLFPSPIVSVGGNMQNPFVELANGVRLQVGARLPNGYQIVNIDGAYGIELSREGRLVHVTLNL